MSSVLRVFIIALLYVVAGFSVGGCGAAGQPPGHRPVIVASIFPVADLVRQLTGDWAEVTSLLSADRSPHDAELPPDQLRLLARADCVVLVGMGLDPWADRAIAALGDYRQCVIRFSDMVLIAAKAKESSSIGAATQGDFKNNHLWLDPVMTAKFVEGLSGELKARYPEHAEAITAAAGRLTADLRRIDREYAVHLAAVPEKRLITYHNAFDLIAARYGLQIVVRLTDIELSPGGEVTPDRIREAIDAIKKYKLKTLYAEPEFPDQVIARLHEETGADVLVLDPQGNPSVAGYRTYQEMMRSNLATLVKGQGGKPSASPAQ